MKILEKNQTKVLETEKLLKEIITSPMNFKGDELILKALKSQSGIAKYQNQERNIEPCSLNTVKSISETFFERGFLYLDELRINARLMVKKTRDREKNSKGNKQTATGLKFKVSELELELSVTRQSNFLILVMVTELRSILKKLAVHEGNVEERKELYKYHNRKIEAELSYTLNGEVLSSKLKQLSELIKVLDGEGNGSSEAQKF